MDPELYDHVRHLIQDRHCHTVRVVVTDCSHVCRSRFVPAKAFLQAVWQGSLTYPSALDSLDSGAQFVLRAGDGFEGGFPSWILKPDLSTWMAVPWAPGAARVMGDLYTAGGEPVEHAPRHVLRRVLQDIDKRGWRIRGAFELEFYVYQRDALPSLTPVWEGLHCFSETIQSRIHAFFDAIIQGFEDIGAQPQIANTEYGPGQFEITNAPLEGLAIADMAVYHRLAVKEIAESQGLLATFMAKPTAEGSGSGGHLHLSLVDTAGRNLFDDPARPDGLSDLCRHAVAGQLAHAPALCALMNGTINSYKRLRPYSFAPYRVCWGHEHRAAMIRIPHDRGARTRIENRLAGADVNPYLALAGVLAASLDGIDRKLTPPAPVNRDPYADEHLPRLPQTLPEALEALEADEILRAYLGESFVRHYLALRRAEWERFCAHITDWERSEYLELL